MDDLISRDAAIAAIKPLLYSGNCVSTLINMPTIDAIPVEWLHKKREQMIDAAQNTPEQAIAYVLWMWQKEQEAQDGC